MTKYKIVMKLNDGLGVGEITGIEADSLVSAKKIKDWIVRKIENKQVTYEVEEVIQNGVIDR